MVPTQVHAEMFYSLKGSKVSREGSAVAFNNMQMEL
jgi:hypothetical protein